MDFIGKIQENRKEFSKGQKIIGEYIINNYEKAVFLTAQQLGDMVGVSESTVVRFAMKLGYKGYPEFQAELEEFVKDRLQVVQQIDLEKEDQSEEELIDYVFNGDCMRIQELRKNLDKNVFDNAVEHILSGKHVYIVGMRSCLPLVQFLGFYLNMIREDVCVVTSNNSSEIFEQMIHLSEKDVVIGISLPRYSMRTLKALEFASSRKAIIITITDNAYSPLALYSSCNLYARSDMSSVAESLAAPMSLMNALVMAISLRKKNRVIRNIQTLEKVWKDYSFDDSDEIDLLSEDAVKDLKRLEKKH